MSFTAIPIAAAEMFDPANRFAGISRATSLFENRRVGYLSVECESNEAGFVTVGWNCHKNCQNYALPIYGWRLPQEYIGGLE